MVLHVILKSLVSITLWFSRTFFRNDEDFVFRKPIERVSTRTSTSSITSAIVFNIFAPRASSFSRSTLSTFCQIVYILRLISPLAPKTSRVRLQISRTFSFYPSQITLWFLLVNTSLLQNYSLSKTVPHFNWRRTLASSSRYTATQLLTPNPMSSGFI